MRVLVLFVVLSVAGYAKAQEQSDSIYISRGFLGYKYYYQDQRLNINDLPPLMHERANAYEKMVKAKNMHVTSSIISGVGGFLIGLQLANVIISGEPNWKMAAVGGGLVVVSVPIFSKSNKLTRQAVEIYNHDLSASSEGTGQLLFSMGQHGAGIKLVF